MKTLLEFFMPCLLKPPLLFFLTICFFLQAIPVEARTTFQPESVEEAIIIHPDDDLSEISPHEELVDETDKISDEEAEYELAAILKDSSKKSEVYEALHLLQKVLAKQHNDIKAQIQLGFVYLKLKEYEKANDLFSAIEESHPADSKIILQIAIGQTGLGHAAHAECLFQQALQRASKKDLSLFLLDYAGSMMLWGDFYQTENIYKEIQPSLSGKEAVALKLKVAFLLQSEQRYAEAEQLYRKIYLDNDEVKALEGLARLQLVEKDFCSVIETADQIINKDPDNEDILIVKGEALSNLHQFEEAKELLQTFLLSARNEDDRFQALVLLGKIFLKLNNPSEATAAFCRAMKADPAHPAAIYYSNYAQRLETAFIEKTIKDSSTSQILNQWGDLYAEEGYAEIALEFYQKATVVDPEFFPAKLNVGGMLSVLFRYEEAFAIYENLLKQFPNTYRLMLERSRTMSWSQEYDESIRLYDKLIALNPSNPLPIIEKARVAMWNNQGRLSMKTYKSLLSPSVDQMIYEEILKKTSDKSPQLPDYCTFLFQTSQSKNHKPYNAYESLLMIPEKDPNVEEILNDFQALYKIQKLVFLESREKWLVWIKRPMHAIPYLEELVKFSPGNEEAIFDYAQVNCTLGLCDEAVDIYEHLLDIDPLHSVAQIALKHERISLEQPVADFHYNYWHEVGRGGLSSIVRQRQIAGAIFPITCRYHIGAAADIWEEKPTAFSSKLFTAEGASINFTGIFNRYFSGSAAFTLKNYNNNSINTRYLGHVNGWYDLCDYLSLGAGFERQDVITNYFGIIQGIQSNNYWAGWKSDITRRWYTDLTYQFWDYTDHNSQHFILMNTRWQFTELPLMFRVGAQVEYHNTAHLDRFIMEGSKTVDIIHPYWCPQEYWAGRMIFEWYHDYAFLRFCGNLQHYYSIKLSLGDDTENNAAAALIMEWRHDIDDHWTLQASGFVERSMQWDAQGVWTSLNYNF